MDVQDLLKTLKEAAEKLTTLEIVTRVGPATITGNDLDVGFATTEPADASLVTHISITGDIFGNRTKTTFGDGFPGLVEYHEKMVEKSQEIVDANIKTIIELVKFLATSSDGQAQA